MRTTAPTRRRLGAGLAATLLALALAACGPSDDGPGVASAGGGGSGTGSGGDSAREGAGDDRGRDFARCMREQGVDMEDPAGDGSVNLDMGTDLSGIDDAIGACRQHMPNGGELAPLPAEQQEALRSYAACMREQGVEMEDPDPTGLPGRPRGPKEQVDAAAAVCDDLLAGLRAGAGASDGGDV